MIIGKPFLVELLRYKFRSVKAVSKIEHFTYKPLTKVLTHSFNEQVLSKNICEVVVHLGKNTVPKTSTNSLDLRMISCLLF